MSFPTWLLPACMCPGWVLPASFLTDSLCEDQQVDMSQIPFRSLPLGLTSCNILLIPFKSGVSITHRPVVLLNMSHWPSLPNILGVPLPGAGPAFWGALLSLDPLLLGESHCNCSYPPFCGLPPQSYGSWPYASLPPTYFIVASSLYLQLQMIFSPGVQVVLIDSCSVNSYDLGLPVGEGELSVFLDTILITY